MWESTNTARVMLLSRDGQPLMKLLLLRVGRLLQTLVGRGSSSSSLTSAVCLDQPLLVEVNHGVLQLLQGAHYGRLIGDGRRQQDGGGSGPSRDRPEGGNQLNIRQRMAQQAYSGQGFSP